MTREELVERIIDAVTPAIRNTAKSISQKIGATPSSKFTAAIPMSDVQTATRHTRGTTPLGVFGKKEGLKSPVAVRGAKDIGQDVATDGQIYGFVRPRKSGGSELTLSKGFFDQTKDMKGARSGLQHFVAHELIHSQDKHVFKHADTQGSRTAKYDDVHPRGEEFKGVAYLSNPSEVKAYGSTLGTYGAQDYKRAKLSRRQAMTNVSARIPVSMFFGPSIPANTPGTLTHQANLGLKVAQQQIGDRDYIKTLPSSLRRRAHKGHHQFQKALYQGVEQVYPQQTRAFKSSKAGMVHAPKRPMLPESREELIEAILESDFSRRLLATRKKKLHSMIQGGPGPSISDDRYQNQMDHLIAKISKGNFAQRKVGNRVVSSSPDLRFYDNL